MTCELQIYDACTKTHIEKNPCTLIVQNVLNATAVDNQDESLLHQSHARYYGRIVECVGHVHDGKQRSNALETNITLKHNGKYAHVHFTKATKL